MILLNKPVGQTPLQALDKLRTERPEFKSVKLSYAGRLDPMAEGLLLVMVGEENKNREKYLNLDKEYEVEIVFGIETDSYDILGLVKGGKKKIINKNELISSLNKFIGKVELPYPPYSSKPVGGIPLFEWARQGIIKKIKVPKQDSFINSVELIRFNAIDRDSLEKYVLDSTQKVTGDFRQDKITDSWKKYFEINPEIKKFDIAKIKISCQSGAYMRSIAHELGKMLGTKAIALTIKRTRIGEWHLQ
ncbi:MAG: hypothetical protein Q7S19_03145 [bacterium]|nr:hypothetical protein [bacterium]